MDASRLLAGLFLAVVGAALAVPPAQYLVSGADGVWGFILAALGVVVSLSLVVGAVLLLRADLATQAALRVAGWTTAGLVLTLVVLGIASRVAAISVPPFFAAVILAVTAFAHVIIGVNDVRRIRAEELAAERRKSAVFTRVLRHNLRTEAQLLAGVADRVTDGDPVRQRAESLAALSDAATEIDRALNREEEAVDRVNLAELTASAVADVRESHPDAAIDTSLADCSVEAGRQFRVAVRELLQNAVEHGDPPVSVTVTCADEARVTVADAGDGIPETERDLLAGDRPETQLEHSSGLGLWTAKWIPQSYGGDIRFRDDGRTVVLWLPR
ncbi:MAG: sensor histidine kinase [Halobacteriaceae archaeon]